MTPLPKFTCPPGTRAICAMCASTIEYTAEGYWTHLIGNPRHIALPTAASLAQPLPPRTLTRAEEVARVIDMLGHDYAPRPDTAAGRAGI